MAGQLINTLFLPLNYLLEFGFFFLIAWIILRRYGESNKLSREQVALGLLLGTSVLVCTFVRSSVISFNDLGWRGLLVAQFVIVLWSVEFWPSWATVERSTRKWLQITLALGAAGTAYQTVMLRIYPILVDSGAIPRHEWISPDRQVARRTMATRQAYRKLASVLPEDTFAVQPKERGGRVHVWQLREWRRRRSLRLADPNLEEAVWTAPACWRASPLFSSSAEGPPDGQSPRWSFTTPILSGRIARVGFGRPSPC